jgi:predicted ATPase
LGTTLFFMGAVAAAHTHYRQGILHYHAQQHHSSDLLHREDAGVICLSRLAWVLWILGYPEQGLARSHEAVMLAQQTADPFSRCLTASSATIFHAFRREVRVTQERAEAVIHLAQEQGFPYWMAVNVSIRGWTLAHQGQVQEGIAQLIQGLRAYHATGAGLLRLYFLTLLAEAHGTQGEPKQGLTVLTEALTRVETTGERWYEAELHRLKGDLLLQQSSDHAPAAEACFYHAISIAQSQSAKAWELRAATSLARLWQSQDKRKEAYDLLAPVYGWFTEGFDTADLQDAKALLDALSESR